MWNEMIKEGENEIEILIEWMRMNRKFSFQIGFKGYGVPSDKLSTIVPFVLDNQEYTITHGSVLIAAITSCTNTSNPSVMLGAGKYSTLQIFSRPCSN
jgi:aconitase A